MDFTVTVDPKIIDILGIDKVNAFLQNAVTNLKLKVAAQEALDDLTYFNELVNDPAWQTAREQAWAQEKRYYQPKAD